MKAVFKGKFIALKTYLRRYKINNLNFYLRKFKIEDQIKSTLNKKEIKFRAEINVTENTKKPNVSSLKRSIKLINLISTQLRKKKT